MESVKQVGVSGVWNAELQWGKVRPLKCQLRVERSVERSGKVS